MFEDIEQERSEWLKKLEVHLERFEGYKRKMDVAVDALVKADKEEEAKGVITYYENLYSTYIYPAINKKGEIEIVEHLKGKNKLVDTELTRWKAELERLKGRQMELRKKLWILQNEQALLVNEILFRTEQTKKVHTSWEMEDMSFKTEYILDSSYIQECTDLEVEWGNMVMEARIAFDNLSKIVKDEPLPPQNIGGGGV